MDSEHPISAAPDTATAPVVHSGVLLQFMHRDPILTDLAKTPTHQNNVSPSEQPKGFQFLKLPLEIRLLIYKELFAPPLDAWPALCCLSCQQTTRDWQLDLPDFIDKPIFPAILRTNKTLLEEGLPIMYSNNDFKIICDKKEAYSSTDRFIVPERPITGSHVKHGEVLLPWFEVLETFPMTWRSVEPRILAVYGNLETITLALKSYREINIKMVRQRYKPKPEYLQRMKDSLNSSASRFTYHTTQMLRLCERLMRPNCPGPLEDTIFGIKSIDWVEWEDPEGDNEIERTYYLRCDEDTNDESLVVAMAENTLLTD